MDENILNMDKIPDGLTSEKELIWLYHTVVINKPQLIVELGTWLGRSFCTILQAVQSSYTEEELDCLKLYAIDDWNEEYAKKMDVEYPARIFEKYIANNYPFLYKRTNVLRGKSWNTANNFRNNVVDFIFVDAAHDQKSVRMDLYAWYPKLKDNAVFCGHDFRPQMGVQLALKEFMKEHPYTLSRMKGGSIWQLHHK
jgi:predicted O-methyltransferase YrrM